MITDREILLFVAAALVVIGLAGPRYSRTRLRQATVAATAIACSLTLSGIGAGIVAAHCPDVDGVSTEVGHLVLGSGQTAEGVEGTIEYTNPNPCSNSNNSSFSAEAVTLARTWNNDGWVQMGWIRREAWTVPRYYCEFRGTAASGPFWHLHDATTNLSVADHSFRFVLRHDESGDYFECLMDGTPRLHTHSTAQLGWSHGTHMQSGGEAYSLHAQIGQMAPSKLDLTNLRHKTSSGWVVTNFSQVDPPQTIYEIEQPSPGWLRNWTNAH